MSGNDFSYGGGYSTSGGAANVSFGQTPDQPGNQQMAPQSVPLEVKDISTREFGPEVIEASKQVPVLVDFWAPWCGPCKQLAPALEAAVAATKGQVKLVKMDIDKHPEIPGQMGIQSIPAVVAFVDGRPADMFMGAKPEGEIREFIAKVAGPTDEESQIEAALEHAADLVRQGAVAEASQVYGQILQFEPGNLKAIAALGQIYISSDNLDAARALLASVPDEARSNAEIASLESAIELAEQASGLGDIAELEAKVSADPADHASRMDLAIALNGSGKREEAADHLLEIMRRQPGWNDDAAKTQLLQLFEAWGLTDEVTVSARRKLSSLLFS